MEAASGREEKGGINSYDKSDPEWVAHREQKEGDAGSL
jgi:hypothetical protein